ncbi:MAG: hypothetical protein Q7S86_04960 [bacterium]|nr:hypothetical protein [bacterium]
MTLKNSIRIGFPFLFQLVKRLRNYCVAFFPPLSFILKYEAAPVQSEPWINVSAKNWLGKYLQKDMRVFEYGSGGSTLYMAKRVKELLSVESDIYWYSKVTKTIRMSGITNCKVLYAEASPSPSNQLSRDEGAYVSYAEKIKKFPNDYFNLVYIDGRGRELCVRQSLSKIKKGGYLLLDNTDRPEYKTIFDFLKAYSFQTFTSEETTNMTTVWKIN